MTRSPPRLWQWGRGGKVVVLSARVLSILFNPFPESVTELLQKFSSGAVFYGAGCLCVMRARSSGAEGFAWRALALAMFMWGTGDLYFAGVLSERDVVPYPSLADALWLGFYLPAYAAIGSFLRRRVGSLSRGARLDALIGGLGVGSAGATLAFGVALDNTTGSAAAIATNLAYPVGDLGLLALIGVAITVTGWKAAGGWRWIAVAFAIFAVADSIFLVQVAQGTYATGDLVDLGWPAAALLIGLLAWRDAPLDRVGVRTETGMVIPAISGFGALVLLVVDHLSSVRPARARIGDRHRSSILCASSWRGGTTSACAPSRQDATTVPVTGPATKATCVRLARHVGKFDPDAHDAHLFYWLKQYNATFGHPAGMNAGTLGGDCVRRWKVAGGRTDWRRRFCCCGRRWLRFSPTGHAHAGLRCRTRRGLPDACHTFFVCRPKQAIPQGLAVADRRMYTASAAGAPPRDGKWSPPAPGVAERSAISAITSAVRWGPCVANATRWTVAGRLELTVRRRPSRLGQGRDPTRSLTVGPSTKPNGVMNSRQRSPRDHLAHRHSPSSPNVRATQERHDARLPGRTAGRRIHGLSHRTSALPFSDDDPAPSLTKCVDPRPSRASPWSEHVLSRTSRFIPLASESRSTAGGEPTPALCAAVRRRAIATAA